MKFGRMLPLFLALLLLCAPVLAESGASDAFVLMGLEANESNRDWTIHEFFADTAKRSGISLSFRQYGNADAYAVAKAEAFASDNLPDAFFKAYLTPQEEMQYAQSGQLIDLAPLLAEHAPSLSAILDARPDWRAIITQPDGVIASLPALNGAERQCVIWINRAWLDALSLQMPTTIAEYTDVLRAFRDGDPNANAKADEEPLSLMSPWEAKYFLHAWGLTPNDYNIHVDDSGTVQFAPFAGEYREFITWLRLLVTEGLISEDAFRSTQTARTSMMSTADRDAANTVGGLVSVAPYSLVDMNVSTDYAALIPLEYNGERVYRRLLTGVTRGTFAITSACEDVPALLSWVDYLYTEEGGRLAYAGKLDVDYTITEGGSWRWLYEDDLARLTEMSEQVIISGDTVTPGLEPAAFMRNSEIAMDNHTRRQTDLLNAYLVEPFPVYWPVDEAREARIAELQLSLATCLDTAIANYALGKTEMNDETWSALQQELRDLGAEEFVSLWQQVYDELP